MSDIQHFLKGWLSCILGFEPAYLTDLLCDDKIFYVSNQQYQCDDSLSSLNSSWPNPTVTSFCTTMQQCQIMRSHLRLSGWFSWCHCLSFNFVHEPRCQVHMITQSNKFWFMYQTGQDLWKNRKRLLLHIAQSKPAARVYFSLLKLASSWPWWFWIGLDLQLTFPFNSIEVVLVHCTWK